MARRLLALGFLLTASGAGAEAVAYSSTTYVQAVLAVSPETQKAKEELFAASEKYRSGVAGAFLPALTFTGTMSPAELGRNSRFTFDSWRGEANDFSLTPGLSWNLFDSFQDALDVRSARLSRESAREDLEIARQARALEALRTFFDLLLKRKLLEVARANREAQLEQYRLTQDRYKHGMKSLSDLLKTETDWRSSELNVESAEAEMRLARFRFNVLLEKPEDHDPELRADLVLGATEEFRIEDDMRRALVFRPEMKKDRLRRSLADTAYQQALRRILPSLSLDFDATHPVAADYGSETGSFGLGTAVYGFTLKLSLPSGFNAYSQAKDLSAAKASWRESRQDSRSLERSVREEVYRAQVNLQRSLRSYQISLRKEEISKQNYEIVSEQYSQGSADVIRLSQALVDYVEAQRERMRAYSDSNITRAEYRRALGDPIWH